MITTDINKVVSILEEQYCSDGINKTIKFFKDKGVSLDDLLEWQKHYPIILPHDDYYNTLRIGFNRIGQFFPKFIVMIKNKKDVQWALEIIKKYNIPFVAKSGGHCSQCYSLTNGIIIDVTNRNYIKVLDNDTVKVGAGARLGFIVEELCKHSSYIPTGTCPNVSITGYALGAGIGLLRRKFGLACDNMLSATIVLANGEIVKCNKDNHSDLFFAMRGGGGGSFGIVTDFVFQTHKINKFIIFELYIPFCHFEKALDTWQRFAAHTVDNLTSFINLYSPKEKGEPITISGQFLGRKKELLKLLEIFDGLPTSTSFYSKNLVDAEKYCAISDPPYFYKYLNLFANEYLSMDAIIGLKKIMKKSLPNCSLEIDSMGGAISKISSNETAFPWRDSIFWLVIRTASDNQEDISLMDKWTRSTYDYLIKNGMANRKTGLPMSYCNFKDPELTKEQYPLVYFGSNAKKLSKIKTKYDPNNLFNYTQSIPLK